jgi:ribosomal protein L40E
MAVGHDEPTPFQVCTGCGARSAGRARNCRACGRPLGGDGAGDVGPTPELPPNKLCPRCGAENIASAEECLDCHRSLGRAPEEIYYIGADRAIRPAPYHPPGPSGWRPVFRFFGVVGLGILGTFMSGWPAKGDVGAATFVIAGVLVVFASAWRVSGPADRSPLGAGDGALDILDTLLRGLGCVTSVGLLILLALFALLMAAFRGFR